MPARDSLCLHASCVALEGRALLITGASGSGKSSLALQLMAYGTALVADDRVVLEARDGQLFAHAPSATEGLIEARGVGLLRAPAQGPVLVTALVDLDDVEDTRLPVRQTTLILGVRLIRLRRAEGAHFAPALLQYLKCGALDPDA
ncbi:HPr kinase/phosphorylase [Cribrihabitans neustonicus]|uniref:HPr kinase/phosphorylase n=1 Tax=Cribrihabitans neustonicus TaxID=1429085 RepID=UPI003B5C10B0